MNAVIMAAGTSSRFVPLCWERPKGLLEVRGEVLAERQIQQLKEAGVDDITLVTGYMAEKFEYLKDKFAVSLVFNPDYARYNNTSTLLRVLDRLGDTWICSSDNYFTQNIFLERPSQSQYSAEYAEGQTAEYCLFGNERDEIVSVTVGGADAWYMIGPVFFSREFSEAFRRILVSGANDEEMMMGYWEDAYIRHLSELPMMRMRKFSPGIINEFDTLEELRAFDGSYLTDTHSAVLKKVCREIGAEEKDLADIRKTADNVCSFRWKDGLYEVRNDEAHACRLIAG
ncbi:MAG: NTP transferase domain-containing protein [Prevotella sp.]|nr:NTP transferase domain-containing protein [Prevotella sp.]